MGQSKTENLKNIIPKYVDDTILNILPNDENAISYQYVFSWHYVKIVSILKSYLNTSSKHHVAPSPHSRFPILDSRNKAFSNLIFFVTNFICFHSITAISLLGGLI
jgi:hypothetical protein